MPRYRCFCLTDDDKIAWGTHVQSKTLKAAIIAGHRACQKHSGSTFSRVEIWLGNRKLHTSPERFARRATWIDP